MTEELLKSAPNNLKYPTKYGFEETFFINGTEIIFYNETLSRLKSLLDIYQIKSVFLNDYEADNLKKELKKLVVKSRYYKTARCIISFNKNLETEEVEESIKIEPDPYLFSIGKILENCIVCTNITKPIGESANLPSVSDEFKKLILNDIICNKADDGFILNSKNSITESYLGNIFFIEEDHVVTPSTNTGCNPWIMRDIIIEELKSMKLPVIEKDFIRTEELINSKEIIVAGSYGIYTVTGIDKQRYFSDVRNLLIARILKRYINK